MPNIPRYIYIPANTGMTSPFRTTATGYMQNDAISLNEWIPYAVKEGTLVIPTKDSNVLLSQDYDFPAQGTVAENNNQQTFNQNTISELTDLSSQLFFVEQNTWSLNGDAINTGQFIGTINANPFIIRTNNVERMRILSTGGVAIDKTTVGTGLSVDTANDIAISGIRVGHGNNNIQTNTVVGEGAATSVTTGGLNSIFGRNAGASITTGTNNVLIGNTAGTGVTTGSNNVIINGNGSTAGVTTGSNNTIIGNLNSVANVSNEVIISDGSGNRRINIGADGNVGIGITNPNGQLQLANTVLNKKIVLFQNNGVADDHQFFGFGVNAGVLRYQTSANTIHHVFYAATSGSASSELMRIQGNGKVAIGTATPSSTDLLTVNGTIAATSASITVISDRKEKEDINLYSKGLKELMQIEPVTFKYLNSDVYHVGVIAQDIEKILPETVVTVSKTEVNEEGEEVIVNESKAFSGTADLIYVLINAVRELTERVTTLEAQLK